MIRTTTLAIAAACALLGMACGGEPGEGEMAEDTAAAEMMEGAMAEPTISLADVAGTWDVRSTTEAGDTIPHSRLVATAGREGWEVHLPDRDPLPARVVAVEADSIVVETDPYPSILREGVNVAVTRVIRLEGDRLVGTFVARYETTAADSLLRGRFEATRASQ